MRHRLDRLIARLALSFLLALTRLTLILHRVMLFTSFLNKCLRPFRCVYLSTLINAASKEFNDLTLVFEVHLRNVVIVGLAHVVTFFGLSHTQAHP